MDLFLCKNIHKKGKLCSSTSKLTLGLEGGLTFTPRDISALSGLQAILHRSNIELYKGTDFSLLYAVAEMVLALVLRYWEPGRQYYQYYQFQLSKSKILAFSRSHLMFKYHKHRARSVTKPLPIPPDSWHAMFLLVNFLVYSPTGLEPLLDSPRGTKECRKRQHWLGLQELVACCLEPFKGLCLALGQ